MTLTLSQDEKNIHEGDVGTMFLSTIYKQDGTVVNLSTASALTFIFTDPTRVSAEEAGTLYTDGTDGKVFYTLKAGDIDMRGEWYYQVKIVSPAGTWRTNVVAFTVYRNLPDEIVPPAPP